MLHRLQDVFESFQRNDVRYVVIGGIAAVMHGVPRATFDLDVLIEATPENARHLLAALRSVGFATADQITPDDLIANEITVFNDRVRIDVQTSTPGLAFDCAWANRVEVEFRGYSFFVTSRNDLIAAKRASGRAIDLEDVKQLESGSGS